MQAGLAGTEAVTVGKGMEPELSQWWHLLAEAWEFFPSDDKTALSCVMGRGSC